MFSCVDLIMLVIPFKRTHIVIKLRREKIIIPNIFSILHIKFDLLIFYKLL